MEISSPYKGRKNLKNLVHRIQGELLEHSSEGVVSTRYRDAFFYLLAEKWLIASGISDYSKVLQLLGFSADSDSKNTVSDLLSEPLYKDAFWPSTGLPFTEDFLPLETLGWLYQYWNGRARDSVTWAVSRVGRDGLHNESVTLATQIYTERYMAEYLVQQVFQTVDSDTLIEWSVIDPACGSGHILLIVYEHAEKRLGENFLRWVLSGKVQGVDIDATAVSITRVVLLLYLVKIGICVEELESYSQVLTAAIRTIPAPLGTLCRNSSNLNEKSYDVVITNPPYIGRRKLHPELREFLSQAYSTASGDLAFAFTVRCIELLKPGGHLALVSNDKWIRLRTYHGLRWSTSNVPGVFSHLTVQSLVELGGRAFHREAELHDGVGVALLHAINTSGENTRTFRHIDLTEPKDFDQKVTLLRQRNFKDIRIEHRCFSSPTVGRLLLQAMLPDLGKRDHWTPLGQRAAVVVGIQTNEDRKFVVPQWLLPVRTEGWIVHHRGGGVQKWFGLNRWMLDLVGVRTSLRAPSKGPFPVEAWFEREGWTYSWFASGTLALRKKEKGWSFGRAAASGVFLEDLRMIGFLNSSIGSKLATKLSGKVQLPEGVVREVPIPNDLSVISLDVINRLIAIQQLLVAQDPREVTFAPSRIIPPLERIQLEREYHDYTLQLEAASHEAAAGEFLDKRPTRLKESSRSSGGATKSKVIEIIERLGSTKNIRPEQLMRSIFDELRHLGSDPAELLIDLLVNEERVQRVVWSSYLFEKIHCELLTAVGHLWRGEVYCTGKGYRSISIEELKQISKNICSKIVDGEKAPASVVAEFEASCGDWLSRKFPGYHESVFSGHPLLKFSEGEITHIFDQ